MKTKLKEWCKMSKRDWIFVLVTFSVFTLLSIFVFFPNTCSERKLKRALDSADRYAIQSGRSHMPESIEPILYYESSDSSEVRNLIDRIEVNPLYGVQQSCRCAGHPDLVFYEGDEHLLTLHFHHRHSFSWKGWKSHGRLSEESAGFFSDLIDQHDVKGVY